MKKIASVLFVICMLFAAQSAFAEYADVYEYDSYYNAVNRLQDIGIISGYEDGTFRPSNYLTRAEFAKIIVSALDKESDAKSMSASSTFFDVPQGHWATPYISYVSSKKIVSGYPDGSYGPSNTITYAEALTIVGRMLGYTEETIGAYWPNNYIEMAKSIGLTADFEFGANMPMNRAVAAVVLDRALFTTINKTDIAAEKTPILLQSLGYTVLEDMVVLSAGSEDGNLYADEIKLNNDSVYTVKMQSSVSAGAVLKYVIVNEDGEIVCVKNYSDDVQDKSKYTVIEDCYIIASYLEDKSLSQMQIRTSKGTFTAANNEVFDKVGEVGRLVLDKENKVVSVSTVKIVPVMASHDYTSSDYYMEGTVINHDGLTVYRDGKTASVSDIKKNDVVYYNTKTNTMEVYTKKVTGIYYDALPSKAYVSEVTVGGKNYVIGEKTATSKLDASAGAFAIGDRLTLLLGKNDEVVFAVELTDVDSLSYGVLTESGQKIAESGVYEGSSEYYAKIFMPDGEVYEYSADKDYDDYIGKLVSIKFGNGEVSLTTVGKTGEVYGSVDITNRKIGGKEFLKEAKIIQRISDENDSVPELEILDFETLEVSGILEKNVLGAVFANSFGDISVLYVTGLGNSSEYGVLTSVSNEKTGEDTRYTYKIYNSDGSREFITTSGYSLKANAISFKVRNGEIAEMKDLYKLKSANRIGAVEGTRIMIDNTVYKMSSDVEIIVLGDYKNVSVNELSLMKNIASVTIYSDKANGIVRLVTVKMK